MEVTDCVPFMLLFRKGWKEIMTMTVLELRM